ncbi:MAG: hypothetical protein ACOY0T_01255 [Myxococcota bacterium]
MSCVCVRELWRELSHPTLFDEGIEAARNACVAGASLAAGAITASAWYDNPLNGARALRESITRLRDLPCELQAWCARFAPTTHPETGDDDWSPGFGFVDASQAELLLEIAERLSPRVEACVPARHLAYFCQHHQELTAVSGHLNATGLAALVLCDHNYELDDAERTFLVARIDLALRQAALARRAGLANFPFFTEAYVYEGNSPPPRRLDLTKLMREVGL